MARQFSVFNEALAEPWFRLEQQSEDTPPVAAHGPNWNDRWYDRLEHVETSQLAAHSYQRALELHQQVEARGARFVEHSRVRQAVADYLRGSVVPWAEREYGPLRAMKYSQLAAQLAEARPWGVWGVDVIDEVICFDWTNKAGLVKLCPDDARAEGARVSGLYVPRIEALQDAGYEVRFGVFTIPNVPRWHLEAGIDAIFSRLKREILFARVDGRQARSMDDPKRRFPHLKGAMAVLEAPLSRHSPADWNIHLNVLLVFEPSPADELEGVWRRLRGGRLVPDYESLRDAWAANVEFREVPSGAAGDALRELVKYPLQAVTFKSEEHRRSGKSKAPPLIEWPPDAFDEWWRAHAGLRRTRSWGLLYASLRPDASDPVKAALAKLRPVERDPVSIDWLGKVKVSPSRFTATLPMPDTRLSDERSRRIGAELDSILGNKFAADFPRSRLDSS